MAYIKVGNESEIVEGKALTVRTKQGRIGLTRINGEIRAFEDVCTHDDGPLADGDIEGEEIICPRHGARFNMCTGKVTKMPATEDIEVYPIRVTDGVVEVDMG